MNATLVYLSIYRNIFIKKYLYLLFQIIILSQRFCSCAIFEVFMLHWSYVLFKIWDLWNTWSFATQMFCKERIAAASNEILPDTQIPSFISTVNILWSNPDPTYTNFTHDSIHCLNVQQSYKTQLLLINCCQINIIQSSLSTTF